MSMRKAAAIVLLAAGLGGCSKTQDTAPETRVFGEPPTIGSVTFEAQTQNFDCDLTITMQGYLCTGGGLTPSMYYFTPDEPIEAHIGYTEFTFNVQVTDPESTESQSDILLVTASFQTPPGQGQAEETSLLLLDDGSDLEFPWQQTQEPLDACVIGQSCFCTPGRYPLTSNDANAGDDIFTRKFGFIAQSETIPPNGFKFVESCMARMQHQAPFPSSTYIGSDVPFKIEATDRAGSVIEWPERPVGHVEPTTWSCTGDQCACCVLTAADLSSCRGLPGIIALINIPNPTPADPNKVWLAGTGYCATQI
jgi:hypothetical protein